MTSPAIDLAALRALAEKADAVDASQPDRELVIYYDYPGCAKDQECRVATAWSLEWAHWIAATTPRKVLALLDELEAARLIVETIRPMKWHRPDAFALAQLMGQYDRAIAGQQPREEGTT